MDARREAKSGLDSSRNSNILINLRAIVNGKRRQGQGMRYSDATVSWTGTSVLKCCYQYLSFVSITLGRLETESPSFSRAPQ